MTLRVLALVVYSLYMFHIVRNLTPLYFVILALFISGFGLFLLRQIERVRFDPLILAIFTAWTCASFVSVFLGEIYGDPLVGLVRLWVTVPLLAVALVLAKNSIRVPVIILSFFFVLAALSFPWQYAFGAIDWFADASERAGGERFASFAGSLTAYGVLVGVPALGVLIYFNRRVRWLLFALLTLGSILSLQKAALGNIAVALLFAVWLGGVSVRLFALSIGVGTVSLFAFLAVNQQDGVAGIVARQLIGVLTSDSELSNDVGFLKSMIDRLTALPSEALLFYDRIGLLHGAGVFGGAGALGYPDLPMAHNGLVEIICIFGTLVGGFLCVGFLYLFVFSVVQLATRRKVIHAERGFLYSAYVIWFVNYLFSGGGVFHPIGAAILWVVVFRIRALSHEYSRERKYSRRLTVGYQT